MKKIIAVLILISFIASCQQNTSHQGPRLYDLVDKEDIIYQDTPTQSEEDNTPPPFPDDESGEESKDTEEEYYSAELDNNENDKDIESSVNSQFVLEAEKTSEGIKLTWTKFNDEMKYYKVIRTTKNQNPKYPKDKYIKTIPDPEITEYIDTKFHDGLVNYFVVAVVKTDSSVEYSNIKTFDLRTFENEIITLTADIINGSVMLSWEPEIEDLKYYKVLRTTKNPYPRYPNDPYIETISDSTMTEYVDEFPEEGTNYYGVSAIQDDGTTLHSNPIEIVS